MLHETCGNMCVDITSSISSGDKTNQKCELSYHLIKKNQNGLTFYFHEHYSIAKNYISSKTMSDWWEWWEYG